MKVMIAGSGAMGCRYGAALFEAGHQVVLLDGWAAHVAARGIDAPVNTLIARIVGLLEATWPQRVNSVHSG